MNIDFNALLVGQILPVYKPASWTSFDVVKKIRSLTGIKKIGHAGTLDPFAIGLLLICTASATKMFSQLIKLPKEYIAQIQFGTETDTLDLTGKVTRESLLPVIDEEKIRIVLEEFKGKIQQEIPSYSAAKYKGKRLYKKARKGEEVPQLFKEVTIHDIELLETKSESVKIRVECSSGTYIRTLARDIARRLKSAGHLISLERTRIGEYTAKDAWTIDALQEELRKVELKV